MPGGERRAGSGPTRAAHRWDFITRSSPHSQNPWNPLWAMMIGFFMIMVDSTIVAIANPTIMANLHIGYDTVVWVTSAYLLGTPSCCSWRAASATGSAPRTCT